MDKTIKTREVTKDIKTLNKKPALLNNAKDIAIKGRNEVTDVAEQSSGMQRPNARPNAYAEEKTEQGMKEGAIVSARVAKASGAKVAEKVGQELSKRSAQKVAANQASTQAVGQATSRTTVQASRTAASNATSAAATTTRQGAIRVKSAATNATKRTAKGTIKGAGKGVKTSAKVAVKSSRSAAAGAKAAAKGTQIAARNAAYAARVTAQATAAAARATARAVAAFVKMAIAAIKSLVAAIAAGGWVAIAVIVIICLVGLIATSAFGIFFTGGDMGDGNPTLREVITETNKEYEDKVEQIKQDNPHDELMLSGSRAKWPEVLAVFSVKTTTNEDSPLDVVTLDAQRQQLLKDIFWDMNVIDSRVEDREFTEITTEEQANGTIIEKTVTTTRRTLYITHSGKTADQMATQYLFSAKQKDFLIEMLSPSYNSAWQAVLYGITSGSGDIVEVAASQLGNAGGQTYWSWYGFSGRVEWCACFVSWCANEVGYIEAGVMPRHSYCQTGIQWFKDAGNWHDRASGYQPKPGDIIYFEWGNGGDSDHVGIVESCDGSTVYTIEGNSGDAVNRRSYSINSGYIIGYGTLG